MTVSPAATAELAEALALLFGPAGDAAHAFRMVARGELDPGGLLVARRDGAVVGAVFVNRLPGNVAVISPPRADEPEVEDALTAAALEHVAGVKAVQAFLPPEELGRAEPLLRTGFCHVTRVWQMERPVPLSPRKAGGRGVGGEGGEPRGERDQHPEGASPTPLTPSPFPPTEPGGEGVKGPPVVRTVRYADCDADTFNATLLRAHDNSLDCPELNRVVTPVEVLTGYGDPSADTARRWLALADGQPAGVLLLNGDELTFLGVVPEHRGRGVGRRLLDVALDTTPRLSLVVDVRNRPAFQLYRAAGLEVVGAREVFLHFPPFAAGTTGPKGRRS